MDSLDWHPSACAQLGSYSVQFMTHALSTGGGNELHLHLLPTVAQSIIFIALLMMGLIYLSASEPEQIAQRAAEAAAAL